jgi:UDP-GlcNAc:undecaprenyl-phosphate/decaprenyl-phosphate GlcNAc-1-phosphate transferase
MSGALSFILAMVVTMTALPLLARMAGVLGVLDQPGGRKLHAVPVPRVGGLAMALGVAVAALLALHLHGPDRWFLIGIGVLVGFGAWDDRVDLDYRVKFVGQLVAVAIVVLWGDVRIRAITLDDSILLPAWISLPLTVVFLVGITNAVNLADGLDGLAGGTTFLSLCAIALLSSVTGSSAGTPLLLAFAGAVLGFLRFNTYPASVFMGDAGSQLLGFSLGVLGIRATQDDTQMSSAILVLLLALPILDTLSVMVHRIGEGRSPFHPDHNHIHHKLLALGFAHHEAVMVVYAIQGALFVAAYLLRFESDLLILAVVSAFFLIIVAALQVATKSGWRLRPAGSNRDHPYALSRITMLPALTKGAIGLALAAYAALIVVETSRLSSDVRLLVGGLLAVIVGFMAVMRVAPLGLTERCVLFVTAAVLVYLDASQVHPDPMFSWASWICVGVAALATAVRLRLLNDRRFRVTPLDLIVLFMALVVPNLPGWSMALPRFGSGAIAKLVIILYAIEILGSRTDRRVVWFRLAAASVLAGLTVRSLTFS